MMGCINNYWLSLCLFLSLFVIAEVGASDTLNIIIDASSFLSSPINPRFASYSYEYLNNNIINNMGKERERRKEKKKEKKRRKIEN